MVKITKLPPQEQHVFFQEHQFDASLGGEDPIMYTEKKWYKGHSTSGLAPGAAERGQKENQIARRIKNKRLRQAKKALDGHENKEAILKILRSE
jgi:hypothetical protein